MNMMQKNLEKVKCSCSRLKLEKYAGFKNVMKTFSGVSMKILSTAIFANGVKNINLSEVKNTVLEQAVLQQEFF